MTHDLENDIQHAWSRAHGMLFSEDAVPAEMTALAASLRRYAGRVLERGLAGERELLWLADRLEGRIDDPLSART